MKNNRINLLLIAFAVIMQRVLFQTLDFESYEFPFASSLMIFQSQTGNLLIILYTFLPIPFILFEFSGMVHELMEGYGKLWIIRAYRKDRLYMKTMISCALKLLMIVLYQILIFSIGNGRWQPVSGSQILWVMAAYYIGLLAMVLLQLVLEFFVDASYANLISNLFFVVSLFLGNLLLPAEKTEWLGTVLFPNMMFGTRNGMIYQNAISVEYGYALSYLLGIVVLTGYYGIFKFNKKDVF
ncbi:MAG: DUF2705 family protein [Oliverpabstia sp.]|nr:DUF2705 family protein [Eubacterium sp.]MDY2594209.1 DUF2705 family protein [Oliverpabstia sp.]